MHFFLLRKTGSQMTMAVYENLCAHDAEIFGNEIALKWMSNDLIVDFVSIGSHNGRQQHYYHARYPTDDWHLAYMFSLVYFPVDVCLVGVFPHSVSTRRDPCVRVCAPLTLASPLTRNKTWTGGDPALHLSQVRGHLNWRMGVPALLGGNLGCWIF